MKSLYKIAAALAPVFALAVSAAAFEGGVQSIATSGALVLEATAGQMEQAGFEPGDLVSVKIGDGAAEEMPVCRAYAEVSIGRPLVLLTGGTAYVTCSYDSFAGTRGLATWDGKRWAVPGENGLSALRVSVEMRSKSAYLAVRARRRLVATERREDYESDAVYANFRVVEGGRLGAHALYRSSIPSSTTRDRARYADRLAREAGIRTVLNLANSPERLKKNMDSEMNRSPYYTGLYRAGNVIARALPAVVGTQKFRDGLADELRFMAAHEGPYLVHCAEGKDRAGFVCFLLAALMGATPAQLERDYGQSYLNFYHLTRGEERYTLYVGDGLNYFYRALGGKGEFTTATDVQQLARAWISGIGLSGAEIDRLKTQLEKNN